jgi:hypothetical protein
MIDSHSFTFKMESENFSEKFIMILQSTPYLILQDNNFHNNSRKKPKHLTVKRGKIFHLSPVFP